MATQKRIARLLEIHEGYLSMIISGQRRPYDLCKKLAELTQTDVQLWMDGTTDEKRAALKKIDLAAREKRTREGGSVGMV